MDSKRGNGKGRRRGQGRMFGKKSAGPDGFCVCPQCGFRLEHKVAQSCYEKKCSNCGAQLIRE